MLTRRDQRKSLVFAYFMVSIFVSIGFVRPGDPPKIIQSSEIEYKKNVGEDVKLRCRATGAQEDSNNRTLFFWKNQFGLIRQDRSRWPRYDIKQNKYLMISSITLEDAGLFICTATNEFGYTDAKRRLRVFKNGKEAHPVNPPKNQKPSRPRPMPPAVKFMKGSEVAPTITISERANPRKVHVTGDSVKLKCLVNNADPPPVITWTKNGKSLQLKSSMRLIHGRKYLHFKSLRPDDTGNYTCIVANKLGKDSYKFILVVQSQVKSKDPSLAPSRHLSAHLSGNFSLTCVINAKPKRGMPRVRWVKYARSLTLVKVFKAPVLAVHLIDTKKYKKNPRTRWSFMHNSNGSIVASLTFVNVTQSDQGIYVCTTGSRRSSKSVTSVIVQVKSFASIFPRSSAKTPSSVKDETEKQGEIPLFLLITVPAVAGLVCITVIFIFWRRHKEKEKLAQRSRPDNHLKLADVEQQQPLRNGTLTKLYPDGTLPVNGSLHPNGSISLNGTVSHNGTLSHNGALSYHGTCPCSGSLSHNGSLNSLRHGVHRTTNGATVTVVHHDPLLGTRLEYIRKGTSDT